MERHLPLALMLILLCACTGPARKAGTSAPAEGADTLTLWAEEDTLAAVEAEEDIPLPTRADELFDDFIFNYAQDPALQRSRTVFPLPYYNGDTPEKIEKADWKHDYLFAQQACYTLLFDNEDDLDLVGDTSLCSVQVEFFLLQTRQVRKWYFQKKDGMWMLEAINLRQVEASESDQETFLDFYARFATDSIYQMAHIRDPLPYITLDPDDEFSILETSIDAGQWSAFSPALPTDGLTNINYGQRNDDLSREKIMKVNGIGNGYSNVFYFKRRHGQWELYKFEDTSI